MMNVLTTLKDNGTSVQRMTEWSGLHRSTIYRWMRGDKAEPDYDSVYALAAPLWRRGYATQARELVEAFGYPWAEPDPDPAPPLIDPEAEAAIRSAAESDEEAEELLAAMRKRRMEKLRATGGAPAA